MLSQHSRMGRKPRGSPRCRACMANWLTSRLDDIGPRCKLGHRHDWEITHVAANAPNRNGLCVSRTRWR